MFLNWDIGEGGWWQCSSPWGERNFPKHLKSAFWAVNILKLGANETLIIWWTALQTCALATLHLHLQETKRSCTTISAEGVLVRRGDQEVLPCATQDWHQGERPCRFYQPEERHQGSSYWVMKGGDAQHDPSYCTRQLVQAYRTLVKNSH